jgi:hypothetical protein
VVYRLTSHPLAKYPGSLLARITSWHDYYHISKGDRHIESWRHHEIFGDSNRKLYSSTSQLTHHIRPIVRFSPNCISINTPQALQDIYLSRIANVMKSDWYTFTHAATGGHGNTHSIVDRERYAVKRRLLSHAFSDSALRSMETHILDNVRKWCRLLGEPADSTKQD